MKREENPGDLDIFVMRARLVMGGELGEEARAALYNDAVMFFRAGGVVSTRDWSEMSNTTKEVYVAARAAYDGERIAVLVAMLGVKPPAKRNNPTAPENRQGWEACSADEEEQLAISKALDEVCPQ